MIHFCKKNTVKWSFVLRIFLTEFIPAIVARTPFSNFLCLRSCRPLITKTSCPENSFSILSPLKRRVIGLLEKLNNYTECFTLVYDLPKISLHLNMGGGSSMASLLLLKIGLNYSSFLLIFLAQKIGAEHERDFYHHQSIWRCF